jgi:hypothetical protein
MLVLLNPDIEPNRHLRSIDTARVVAENILDLNKGKDFRISVVGYGALRLNTYTPPIPCSIDLSDSVGVIGKFFEGLRA